MYYRENFSVAFIFEFFFIKFMWIWVLFQIIFYSANQSQIIYDFEANQSEATYTQKHRFEFMNKIISGN